jgi:hypothetical protein
MTRADAVALELELQAASLGIHSRDCRLGLGPVFGGDVEGTEGCAACEDRARRYYEAEARDEQRAFMWAYETNDEHREEMEREAALFG